MIKTKAAGRELALWWDLAAWFEAEERAGSIDALVQRVTGDEQPAQASALLIELTVNAGYRRMGSEERIDQEWIKKNLGCKAFGRLNAMARRAYIEGMKREDADEEEEAVDLVAQEIKKKETPEG